MESLSFWDLQLTVSLECHKDRPIVRFFFDDEKEGSFFSAQKCQIRYLSDGTTLSEVWVGLGSFEEMTEEELRRCVSDLVFFLSPMKVEQINFCISLRVSDYLRGLIQSLFLSSYRFSYEKKNTTSSRLESIHFCLDSSMDLTFFEKIIQEERRVCQSVCLARTLVSENASSMDTHALHSLAQKFSDRENCSLEVLELLDLEKKGLSLIVAVGQAGQSPPKLLCLSYRGSACKQPEYITLVGKGVVFDSGGQNLKMREIDSMKLDMGGAATVLSVFDWVSSEKLPIDLLVVVPLAHNAIDSSSYFPGDVYSSYSGRTVCVKNTDAEGRLILADAISYAIDQYPVKCMVTVATLTMAVIMAFEHQAAGLMGTDESMLSSFEKSSLLTGERVCRLPLYKEFIDSMKGQIADLNNLSSMGGFGGSSTAGAFLSHFVEKTPWVHFDIAGVAFLKKRSYYNGPQGTGFGVRLLIHWLKTFQDLD